MVELLFGWFLGAIDHAVRLLSLLPNAVRPKFFTQGFGNPQKALNVADELYATLRGSASEVPDLLHIENNIQYDSSTVSGELIIKTGHFLSPLHHVLPEESKCCRFYHVEPLDGTKRQPVTVILLPATGEQGKSERLRMARTMAREHGWSSIIITAPYYAARKPTAQKLFFLQTAEDIMHQGSAIMTEAAALGCHVLSHSSHKVCFSGFSWGAAMSKGAAAICLSCQTDGTRIACVPYVGCGSPCIVADGAIEAMIDWKALQKVRGEPYEDTRKRLYQILSALDFNELFKIIKKQNKMLGSLHILNMTHDQFIPKRHSQVFTNQALDALSSKTNSKVTALSGGHAIAAVIRPRYQKQAIVAAVKALQ